MANLKDSTITSISTTSHGTSANWKTAYDWGNHASAGYASTSAVNAKGDPIPVTSTGEPGDLGNLASITYDPGTQLITFTTTTNDTLVVAEFK